MKRAIVIVICLSASLSCTNNSGSGNKKGEQNISKARKAVISFTSDYLMTQLVKPDRSVSKDGIITLSDSNEEFRIDPGRIAVGDIDGAGRPDAVVPVFTFRNGNVTWIQHLVMLSTGRDYRIVKTFSDMLRVISLENRVLTAEISTVSPDAPGFGCSECKVVLRYVYRDGEIVKAD